MLQYSMYYPKVSGLQWKILKIPDISHTSIPPLNPLEILDTDQDT